MVITLTMLSEVQGNVELSLHPIQLVLLCDERCVLIAGSRLQVDRDFFNPCRRRRSAHSDKDIIFGVTDTVNPTADT